MIEEQDLQAASAQKYNAWCERCPLVCSDEGQINRAQTYLASRNLAPTERDALFLHELTGCGGIEFVAFSNARLKSPVMLSGGVILFPCFLSDIEGRNLNELTVQHTLRMMQKSRYIYDGWIGISTWDTQAVRRAVYAVHQALSIFCMHGSIYFEWESKYNEAGESKVLYETEDLHLQDLESVASVLDRLEEIDRVAIYRSLGWLSQGLLLNEPAAKFLFLFLAIEALATYIEKGAADNSPLLRLRTERVTKRERRIRKNDCIRDVLARELDKNPAKAIQEAYSKCVNKSISKMLAHHLENVFQSDAEVTSLLFTEEVEGKSLYDLRNEIAHGTTDALSEVQRDQISRRIWDVERIARKYIMAVLNMALGVEGLSKGRPSRSLFFGPSSGILSGGAMYRGPIHMAAIYDR